jgi:two-component system, OmpR family, response regulator RegX3
MGTSDPATVLLVEDDPKIASLLTKGLRRQGFLVEWVSTGEESLARLDMGGVDVLLLDLGLPDIDGLEVLREMRQRGMGVPVIVVTGRSDPRDRVIALSLGIRAYVTKPFAWADLLATVRAALDRAAPPGPGDAREMPDRGRSP